jgi:hypothetical protein
MGRGQHDAATQPSPGLGDSEAAVPADVSDAPTIPVLDPVGVADHQAAVVVPGEDDVASADVGGVGQHGFACGTAGGGEAVSACALVQLGRQPAGRRDQQGIASGLAVGLPGTVGLLRCCAGVAEVNALVVGVGSRYTTGALLAVSGGMSDNQLAGAGGQTQVDDSEMRTGTPSSTANSGTDQSPQR